MNIHILDFKAQFTSDDNLKRIVLDELKKDPTISVSEWLDIKDLDAIVTRAIDGYLHRAARLEHYAKTPHMRKALDDACAKAVVEYEKRCGEQAAAKAAN